MSDWEKLAAEAAAVDAAAAAADAPPVVEQEPSRAEAPREKISISTSAQDDAEKIVALLAFSVEKIWPVLGYRDETKAEAAKRLAPLLQKYDVVGTLLGRWSAEIEAGMFFGGVIYASYLAVKNPPQEQKPVNWWRRIFTWSK